MHPPHEVAERVVDQPMLLHEPEAREGRRSHLYVEVVPLTSRVADTERGARQRSCQAAFDLRDLDHPSLANPRTELAQGRGCVPGYFTTQARDGLTLLSQLHFWLALAWSSSMRKVDVSPVQSRKVMPADLW